MKTKMKQYEMFELTYQAAKPIESYVDVNHPCFAYWDHMESILEKLGKTGIETDLILFHPYDRWGFANMSRKDNLTYLEYLLRWFTALPYIWWSLANEYDIC